MTDHINTQEVLDFSKPGEGVCDTNWIQQLLLIQECNSVLTFANPLTGQKYAFCRSGGKEPPTFLPNLSRILYGTSRFNASNPHAPDFEV